MRNRKFLSLILSIITTIWVISGCQNEPQVNIDPSNTSEILQEQVTIQPTDLPSFEEIISTIELTNMSKDELLYAKELGIPTEKVQQDTLSGSEIMELLDWFIEYEAPEKLEQWLSMYPELRSYNDELRRIDAMAIIFLATELIGNEYYGHNMNIWHFAQSLNQNWDLEETWIRGDLYGEATSNSYFGGSFGLCYLDAAGFYYNAAHPSNISGQYPFSIDYQSNSFQLSTPLTYAEGILAIIRLISSVNPDMYKYEISEDEMQYISLAEERKEEIQNAVTDISSVITGTTYYIANDGDDTNDGLSPETAWATPYRAMTADLKYGDGVLFNRGSVWYISVEDNLGETSRYMGFKDGVHVGAYGEGEKPFLRGDIRKANDPSFWEIYYDNGGVKIWKAAEKLRDSAVIVFNEGESWADEVFSWWDGDMQYINPDGTPFIIEKALKKDLAFCNLLDLNCDHQQMQDRANPYWKGDLYLRCDAGNPADIYDTVSVPQEICGIEIFPHGSVSDLRIDYFTMMGAQCTDIGTPMEYYSFSNLEIGWCGGWLQNYSNQEMGGVSFGFKPHVAGGGIGIYSTELKVTDCYIHDCGPMAMILSMHDHSSATSEIITFENQLFSGNLYDRCGAPMHWADLCSNDVPGSEGFISNLVFEDNLVMNTGDGWVYNSIMQSDGGSGNSYWLSAVENGMAAANNDGIYIRNNLFYLSRYSIITLRDYVADEERVVNAQPIFTGNTYVQYSTRPLLQKNWSSEIFYPSEKVMRDLLGDTEGTLVVIK